MSILKFLATMRRGKRSISKDALYIGLMSGTSMDAVDAALVDFSNQFDLIATHSEPFPSSLHNDLQSLCEPGFDEINRYGQLDRQIGLLFANASKNLLLKAGVKAEKVIAIGSHGQTIRHQPTVAHPFSLQIGDPNTIAEITGITTIADFRRRDIVQGGQGAPLTPAFHNFAFRSTKKNRMIVNIGGIANITFLPKDPHASVSGFDCGPGNTLLDQWSRQHLGKTFDCNGEFAARGKINSKLLEQLLDDDYFRLPPPKSTGREHFNLSWLTKKMDGLSLPPEDVQSTLVELSAKSIINAANHYEMGTADILLCGGGVHNKELISRLNLQKGAYSLMSTKDFGVDPDWLEAIAFAWLAKQTLSGQPGNLPAVTGASKPTILGGIFPKSS